MTSSVNPESPQRLPRHLDAVFGLVAITAFGSWFYGFGVLVAPMVAGGISEQTTATAYGLSMFGAGGGAMLAGRWSDRHGSASMFLIGAAVVLAATLGVVTARGDLIFMVSAVVTGTTIGALGHYSLVHATITRLAPSDRTRSITVNTLWGAFASPVFLPVMGAMVTWWSWQAAMMVANATTVVMFLVAALVLSRWRHPVMAAPVMAAPAVAAPVVAAPANVHAAPKRLDTTTTTAQPSPTSSEHGTGRFGVMPGLMVVSGLAGGSTSVLLLYQVPTMTEAGLGLTLASSLAGARGLWQLAGRIPLPWVIRRVGSGRAMVASLLLLAVAAVLLPATGSLPVALAFVVVGGVAVGAMTTVESIFATDLVPVAGIGASLGTLSLARGIGGALGPVAAGQVSSTMATRTPVLLAVAAVAILASVVVVAVSRRHAP